MKKSGRFSQEMMDSYRQYCDNIYQSAKNILEKTLDDKPFLNSLSEVNIFVPCAGSFPSFRPLVDLLSQYKNIRKINFLLIDPLTTELDIFNEAYNQATIIENIQIKIQSQKIGISKFLEDNKNISSPFHIIYFEHPEISAFNSLIDQFSFSNHILLLRQSIPLIASLLLPNGKVIVVCQTEEEIKQAQSLINYGLETETKKTSEFKNLFFPHPYSKSIVTVKPITITTKSQNNKSYNINCGDKLLAFFTIIALLLYLEGFPKQSFRDHTISFFLTFGQIILHRPGLKGFSIKILLCLTQAALLAHSTHKKSF